MPQKDVESCALCAKIQAFQSIAVLSVTLAILVLINNYNYGINSINTTS